MMLTAEHSISEFLNQLTTIQWEWLLATIILAVKMLNNSVAIWISVPANRNSERLNRNTEYATRYRKPARGAEHRALNAEP